MTNFTVAEQQFLRSGNIKLRDIISDVGTIIINEAKGSYLDRMAGQRLAALEVIINGDKLKQGLAEAGSTEKHLFLSILKKKLAEAIILENETEINPGISNRDTVYGKFLDKVQESRKSRFCCII